MIIIFFYELQRIYFKSTQRHVHKEHPVGDIYSAPDKFVQDGPQTLVIMTRILDYISSCYRPHPKDEGRQYFQSVHTCRAGCTLSQVCMGVPIQGPDGGWGGGRGGFTPSC